MWQDALITASSAVATSVEDLLKSREMKSPLDFQSVVSCQIDIITLLGLSYRRKEALCPSIAPEYKTACSHTTQPTTLLFSDDLSKVMQEVCTTSLLLCTKSLCHMAIPMWRISAVANQNNSVLLQKGRMKGRKQLSKNWKM